MMVRNKVALLAGLLCFMLPGLSVSAAKSEYLFDTLKKPGYRRAWDTLLRGQRVEAWLARYSRTHNGVTMPCGTITVQGVRYQEGSVCKPHDCPSSRFYVLFAPKGRKAWGVLVESGASKRFFGNPNETLRATLVGMIDQ